MNAPKTVMDVHILASITLAATPALVALGIT